MLWIAATGTTGIAKITVTGQHCYAQESAKWYHEHTVRCKSETSAASLRKGLSC